MELIFEKYSNSSRDFHKFMLETIAAKFDIYKNNIIVCARDLSDNNVHDLRVASRRFISTLNLYKEIYPTLYFTMIIKMVRKNFKSLGKLRDTHIMIDNCQAIEIQFPLIYDFIKYLLSKEKLMVEKFSRNLGNININELDGMIYFLMRILKYDFPQIQVDFSIFENYINQNLSSLHDLYNQIDIRDLKTVHKFRIAVKKYRYTVEVLQDFIPNFQKLYKNLVKIQDNAGEIQDLVVLNIEFQNYLNKKQYQEEAIKMQVENIFIYLKNKQKQLIDKFMQKDEMIKRVIELS